MKGFTRTLLLFTLSLLFAACGTSRAYKRLPAEEKRFFDAVKIFISEDEQKEYLMIKDPLERKRFAKKLNIWDKYHTSSPEVKEAIAGREVILEMSKDQVVMAWGLPLKIRKSVEGGLYWDIYYYRMVRFPDKKVAHFEKGRRYHPDVEFFFKLLYFNQGLLRKVAEEKQ